MLELADQAVPRSDTARDCPSPVNDDDATRIARLEAEIADLGAEIGRRLEQLRQGDDAGWLAFARLNLRQSDLRVDVARFVLTQAEASGDTQWINSSRQVLQFTGMVRASNKKMVERYDVGPF
jgi:hypothetical protein